MDAAEFEGLKEALARLIDAAQIARKLLTGIKPSVDPLLKDTIERAKAVLEDLHQAQADQITIPALKLNVELLSTMRMMLELVERQYEFSNIAVGIMLDARRLLLEAGRNPDQGPTIADLVKAKELGSG